MLNAVHFKYTPGVRGQLNIKEAHLQIQAVWISSIYARYFLEYMSIAHVGLKFILAFFLSDS